jgi:hypothetical protein
VVTGLGKRGRSRRLAPKIASVSLRNEVVKKLFCRAVTKALSLFGICC